MMRAETPNDLLDRPPELSGALCLCDVLADECGCLDHDGPVHHPQRQSTSRTQELAPDSNAERAGALADDQVHYDAARHEQHGERLRALYRHIHAQQLPDRPRAALCLSGGGIRSATFGLGVLQGLARHNLLDQFAYLSTVSGGGYLGAWLTAWIHRHGRDGVMRELRRDPTSPIHLEPAAVTHLRAYGNYLSPRLGLTSADSWTCVAMIVRNWVLNWLVIVPILLAVLALPRLFVALVQWPAPAMAPVAAFVAGFALVAIGVVYIAAVLPSAGDSDGQARWSSQRSYLTLCLAPVCLASLLLALSWAWWLADIVGPPPALFTRSLSVFGWSHTFTWTLPGIALVVGGVVTQWLGIVVYGWRYARAPRDGRGRDWGALALLPVVNFVTVAVAAGLVIAVANQPFLDPRTHPIVYAWAGAPLVLTLFSLPPILFLPIASRLNRNDEDLEWWARSGGWFLIVMLGWLVLSGLVIGGPWALLQLGQLYAVLGVGGISGLWTLLGGFSSRSPASGASSDRRQSKLGAAAVGTLQLAAIVFAAFVIVGLSWLTMELIALADTVLGLGVVATAARYTDDWHNVLLARSPWWLLAGLIAVAALIGAWMARLVTVNKFSMHALYRNRLIRAYLGASRTDRNPNPFTGFDDRDNVQLHAIRLSKAHKLFHVVSMTLNLVAGAQLARQERKATSFTMSPLHAGSGVTYAPLHPADTGRANAERANADESVVPAAGIGRAVGYRRMEGPIDPCDMDRRAYYGGVDGVSLGTAVTISGAAANPNMGYQSSSIVAFMMTLFNVRLGWWLGNPGPAGNKTYQRSSPKWAVLPLVKEAFGLTDDQYGYVHLSDGGHFENLGLYEMVLRRCHLIVVCDAGQDTDYVHESLAAAIRKIRIDMGIHIEMGAIRMSADEKDRADNKYCAIGRIRYGCVDGEAIPDGTLIYVKPIITGAEPSDVLHYARANPAFPQETTGDQFFGEAQFESYRELGRNTIAELCGRDWERQANAAIRRAEARGAGADDASLAEVAAWEGRSLRQFVGRVERYLGRAGFPREYVGVDGSQSGCYGRPAPTSAAPTPAAPPAAAPPAADQPPAGARPLVAPSQRNGGHNPLERLKASWRQHRP